MAYWLLKSEPASYSWDQLVADRRTHWNGVRNFQAANNLRAMKNGDRAFFYHSNEGKDVVGIVEIVRTFYPDGVGKMHVTAWALGPLEEGENARARRLDAFLTFYGPGGFATPDDVEALELVQQGLANWHEDRWSEMSRGMGKNGEQLNSDEHHLRIFWRRWNELMGAEV